MTVLNSAQDLMQALTAARLFEPGVVEEVQAQVARSRDARAFAGWLVDKGWLTAYQSDVALSDKAQSLALGAYRLIEPLGQGGMGQVFKAVHVRLNRTVAIKMVKPQGATSPGSYRDLLRRFQREAEVAAQLLHPNIVILFDYDEIDGVNFIVMEFVDGVDLARTVQQQGPLPVSKACDYIRQAAQGLQHAFEFGMVHRDIKPSNLLVTRPGLRAIGRRSGAHKTNKRGIPRSKPVRSADSAAPVARGSGGGVVKILDMGLVRLNNNFDDQDSVTALTMQGTVIGTPDYIAPEQARDATRVDIRADLYSLGCTFYFLLTGRPPFSEGSTVEKLFRHQNEQPMPVERIRPNTPREVIAILNRLLAKRPEGRFQTPAELIDGLNRLPGNLLTGGVRPAVCQPPSAQPAETALARAEPLIGPESPIPDYSPDSIILPAKKLSVLQGHTGYVTALGFSPDGKYLASGGIDGNVRLWEVADNKVVERSIDRGRGLGEISTLVFNPSGTLLMSGSTAFNGHNWYWDLSDPARTAISVFPGDYRAATLAFAPDGKMLAAGCERSVLLWNMLNLEKKPTILKGHTSVVNAVAFAPDGKRVASAGADKTARIWDLGRFWSTQKALFEGHDDAVSTMQYSPDGTLLATGGLDRLIRLWDSGGKSEEPVVTLEGHHNGVRLLQFTPTGNMILSVGDGGQIFLWDVTSQTKVREWQIDKSLVQSLAVSPDCRLMAVGSGDGRVIIYDLELMVGAEQPLAAGAA